MILYVFCWVNIFVCYFRIKLFCVKYVFRVVEYDDDNVFDIVWIMFGDYLGDILDSVGSDNVFFLL